MSLSRQQLTINMWRRRVLRIFAAFICIYYSGCWHGSHPVQAGYCETQNGEWIQLIKTPLMQPCTWLLKPINWSLDLINWFLEAIGQRLGKCWFSSCFMERIRIRTTLTSWKILTLTSFHTLHSCCCTKCKEKY